MTRWLSWRLWVVLVLMSILHVAAKLGWVED